MSLREFVASVPKVELNLQLTGAFRRDSLLLLADQNAVPVDARGLRALAGLARRA